MNGRSWGLSGFGLFALALLTLATYTGNARAQDVLVFPPIKDAAPLPAIIDKPADPAEAPRVPPGLTPPATPQFVREAPAPVVVESRIPDQAAKQCTADADCIISDGGCAMVESVNKTQHASWRARVARSTPGCTDLSAEAIKNLQKNVQPVCRENKCGLQVIESKK
ncbi:MAG: hypothetical protein WBK91_01395 [Alphaproteobacteria bacterium]